MKNFRVHYVTLPAQDIFGMVGRCGGGHNSVWTDWSEQGRINRENIIREFEEGLDKICGHYAKLESSILAEGIRNPIIITCGLPRKRRMENLPPEMRELDPRDLLLLESTMGGSRLWIAQKHAMSVPCLINDWTGRFADHPEITQPDQARQYYKDQPKSITFNDNLGLVESFDTSKVGYHLGEEWSEDKLVPLRAPLWIGIMNKYGYRIDKLPPFVEEILIKAGIDQSRVR